MNPVPAYRIRSLTDHPLRDRRAFVLYWMTAYRRREDNFALQRAVEIAGELKKPLVVLEPLRVDYRWASDRFHRFVIDGMASNRAAFATAPLLYRAYVEEESGAGKGLLGSLARHACAVVADDWPCYFLPRMLASAASQVDCRMEAVDSYGLLPFRTTDRTFSRAFDFRRHLQKVLLPYLLEEPAEDPLARVELPRLQALPTSLVRRWPMVDEALLCGDSSGSSLARLPIDHTVPPAPLKGGAAEAGRLAERFLEETLQRYAQERNQLEVTSSLSPYLHFGHISPHRLFREIAAREGWTPDAVDPGVRGSREGFWGMSTAAESFLDQLVTWRELGANLTSRVEDHEDYDSLPEWARKTLEDHAQDERPHLYSHGEFETGGTHDELWNAAQNQLRTEGRIENYLRMLWGKKVLHWSRSPREAYRILVELNNRWALDGRDPNSYSAISWIFGRFDRAWGPEREVFGKVRYMSSDNTRRKLKLASYLDRWARPSQPA